MNSRERIKTIISGGNPDRCGFWLGNPHDETWLIYLDYFGVSTQEELRRHLKDDFRWICAEWGSYKHPDGKPAFDLVPTFADCTDVKEVEAYDWPNPDYLDFTGVISELRGAGDVYRASGMWSCFFHIVAALFGMENYFIKMHTDPDVVDAVTRHVCDFYLEANRRFFECAETEVDAFFFGNDFGTQLDLLVSPQMFDRFILPDIHELAKMGHSYGYQVILHSCGAIGKIIDRLIDAGVDALHPLQALAHGMDAESLATAYRGRIAFIGGIDTQQLLVNETPDDIRRDVRRVRQLLGPNLVVSPSHEALLPNVPPENVLAMAEAAGEP